MVNSLYSVEQEDKVIWVYLEHESGVLGGVSLELLSKGRELADQAGWHLVGLLVGHGVSDLVDKAFVYGADKVILADHPLLENFTIDAHSHAAGKALDKYKPSVFLLGATPNGRDLAGRIAVRLRTGLNADCTGLRVKTKTGVLVCEVSGFGSGIRALIEAPAHRPQMATVRPGVFPLKELSERKKGKVVDFLIDLSKDEIHTHIIERVFGEEVDLTRVPVLIAGGRGVGGDFTSLRALADLLGGEIGATRPPVDEGHIERERQIGQTGVVCSPKVAICCGISGAFHFIVGIEKADIVISINSDPEAPIFEFSDYCIVGDTHQIVPALIEALHATKESVYA